MDGISVQIVARKENCLFRSLSVVFEDEGSYNELIQRAIKAVYVVSERVLEMEI
jgi:hypothetical protein